MDYNSQERNDQTSQAITRVSGLLHGKPLDHGVSRTLPGSAITGREVVQIICSKDKKAFIGE